MKKKVLLALLLITVINSTGCNRTAIHDGSEELISTEVEQSAVDAGELNPLSVDDYDFTDYVELGEYKGLKVEVSSVDVTDADVNASLEGLRLNNAVYTKSEKQVVADGDFINVSYESTIDGKVVQEFTAENREIEMGLDELLEGVDSSILGMSVGETKQVVVNVPEDFSEGSIAGKEMSISISVNSIDEKTLPEVTDEWIAQVSDFETIVEWKDNELKKQIVSKQEQQRLDFEYGVLEQVKSNAYFNNLPTELVEYLTAQYREEDTDYAESLGLSLEDFIVNYYGYQTIAVYESELHAFVQENLREEFLFKALQAEESISVSEEYYDTFISECLEYYGFETEEELQEYYGEETLYEACLNDKTLSVLCSLNEMVVVEEIAEN